MRVTAVLVGVNVAASLSIAAQPQALAQNQAGGGTADFLKSSITELKATQGSLNVTKATPRAASRTVSKTTLSNHKAVSTRVALGTGSGSVKLRPFVPNRKLPSRTTNLSTSFVAQQAQLDTTPPVHQSVPSASSPISGMVTEYAPYYVSNDGYGESITEKAKRAIRAQKKRIESKKYKNAAKVATTYTPTAAPRAVPGTAAMVPGQIGIPCAPQSVQSLTSVAHVPVHHHVAPPQASPVAAPQQEPLSPPNLTAQEQAEMNKLIQLSCAQSGLGQKPQGDMYSRVGPPPFPLSLLPEAQLKDFIRGGRKQTLATSPQGFGSWHGSQQSGPVANALPRSGFKSYAGSIQGFGSYGKPHSAPVVHKVAHLPTNQHQVKKSMAHHIAHTPHAAPSSPSSSSVAQTPVLTYPPYESNLHIGAH